jgi:hypothetical protein
VKDAAHQDDSGFVDYIGQANEMKEVKGIPPIHPNPEELVDISEDEKKREGMQRQLMRIGKFTAKYGYFNLADEEQREELEKIQNHILQDGWLQGHEEITILKDGRAIVVLKYLIPDTPPKGAKSDSDKAK